jgi:hypothetical protein
MGLSTEFRSLEQFGTSFKVRCLDDEIAQSKNNICYYNKKWAVRILLLIHRIRLEKRYSLIYILAGNGRATRVRFPLEKSLNTEIRF